jgi:hypothetical protein
MNLEHRKRKCAERIRQSMETINELWFKGARIDHAVIRRFDAQVAEAASTGSQTLVDVTCTKLEAWASRNLSAQKYGKAS